MVFDNLRTLGYSGSYQLLPTSINDTSRRQIEELKNSVGMLGDRAVIKKHGTGRPTFW